MKQRCLASLVTVVVLLFTMAGFAHAYPAGLPSQDSSSSEEPGDADGGAGDSDAGEGGAGEGGGAAAPAQNDGVSTPRVMVTDFKTTPEQVPAGEGFTVGVSLYNTSVETRVKNVKLKLTPGEGIVPMGGTSSAYINVIYADDYAYREFQFRALPGAEEGPHQMTIDLEYEDKEARSFAAQDTASVVITQNTRADVSKIQVAPAEIVVGQEATVTFTVNNLGRTKLNNVSVQVKDGQPASGGPVFVGTVEPGSSGNVEMQVAADQPLTEPVTLVINWEDANGQTKNLEKQFDLLVMDEMPADEMPMEPQEEPQPQPAATGMPWWQIAALVGVVLLAIVVVVSVVRRRRKRADTADDLALLDNEPLVPNEP